jgi:hypothetical protein
MRPVGEGSTLVGSSVEHLRAGVQLVCACAGRITDLTKGGVHAAGAEIAKPFNKFRRDFRTITGLHSFGVQRSN